MRSVDHSGSSAARGQLRWRQGRRKPRRTTAGSACSGQTLGAGHATTSMTASTSAEKGGCAGEEAWTPAAMVVRAGDDAEGRGGKGFMYGRRCYVVQQRTGGLGQY